MPQFSYRARNAQGGLVEGVLDCADRAVAIRQIESQQCIPVRIELVEPEPKAIQRDGAGGPIFMQRIWGGRKPETQFGKKSPPDSPAAPTKNLKIPPAHCSFSPRSLAHCCKDGRPLNKALSVLEKRLK